MNDLRSELAQKWAKKHNIQLRLFDREYSEKDEEALGKKEFKKMCKEARVDWQALCDTVFTRSLKSS